MAQADPSTSEPAPESPEQTALAAVAYMIGPAQTRLVAFARTPDEMVAAQAGLVAWANGKIERERADAKELEDNYHLAVERKWKHSTIKRHWQRAVVRLTFWEKVRDAMAAGYCLVPDLPVDVFAVRTTRTRPSGGATYEEGRSWAHAPSPSPETPEGDPAGEGRYVAPHPQEQAQEGKGRDANGIETIWQKRTPTGFADVDFPFVLAKTQVLDATAQAMALRVFDDLGVLPGAEHHGGARPNVLPDPLVIGRVVLPRCYGQPERRLCFVVAWFIDVRDLDAIR